MPSVSQLTESMRQLKLEAFELSEQVSREWYHPELYAKLINSERFTNQAVAIQEIP